MFPGCWLVLPLNTQENYKLVTCINVCWILDDLQTAADSTWVSIKSNIEYILRQNKEKSLQHLFWLRSGKLSLDNVTERKNKMRLGMTLTSSPKDDSFVVSLWKDIHITFFILNVFSFESWGFPFQHIIKWSGFIRFWNYVNITWKGQKQINIY